MVCKVSHVKHCGKKNHQEDASNESTESEKVEIRIQNQKLPERNREWVAFETKMRQGTG